MPISVEVKEQLIKEFSASQTYEGMNALQLAQHCCEKLAMLGQPLPGWREIREIIGKGSANDINKGKREYQDQQGKKLTQLNEMPGVTEDMVEVMMLLRQKAFDVVSDSFKTQVIGWQNQVDEFRRQADESDERCEAAIRERDSWERQANDRQALIDGLSEQLEDSRRSSKSVIDRLEASLEEARSQAMVANQRYEQATANLSELAFKTDAEISSLEKALLSKTGELEKTASENSQLKNLRAQLEDSVQQHKEQLSTAHSRIEVLERTQQELLAANLQKDERIAEKDRQHSRIVTQLEGVQEALSGVENSLAAEQYSNRNLLENNERLEKQLKKEEQQNSRLVRALARDKNNKPS